MQFIRNSLFTRSDTMFGVCEALGQDFGISPNWIRVALGLALIYDIKTALIAYAAMAAVVLISRIVYPGRSVAAPAPAEAAPVEVAQAAPVAMADRQEEAVLAQAA